jgi:hypothetical protein
MTQSSSSPVSQARPVGFEPTTFGFEVRDKQSPIHKPTKSLRKSKPRLAAQGQRAASDDPDLATVVAAWSELPETIRTGIVAMVKAASGSQTDRGAEAIGCEEGEV